MLNANATKTVCILGATSSLARSLADQLAAEKNHLLLLARNVAELERMKADISIRHSINVTILAVDLSKDIDAEAFVKQAEALAGPVQCFIAVAGDMGNTKEQLALGNIEQVTQVNYTATAVLTAAFAKPMQDRKEGMVVLISSVAGDRGRPNNFVYGAAKSALNSFASGLRASLYRSGVHVLTVKPGPMDTPMTAGMKSPLIYPREKAAAAILRAMKKKRNVVYVPWFWWIIMNIIKHIPEPIFKKLNLKA